MMRLARQVWRRQAISARTDPRSALSLDPAIHDPGIGRFPSTPAIRGPFSLDPGRLAPPSSP